MSDSKAPLFTLQGKPVSAGDVLHVAPKHHQRYGATLTAEFPAQAGTATMRASNGAVPTVRLEVLSWTPHPETLLREEMAAAGLRDVDDRDIAVWLTSAASRAPLSDEELFAYIRAASRGAEGRANSWKIDTEHGMRKHDVAILLGDFQKFLAERAAQHDVAILLGDFQKFLAERAALACIGTRHCGQPNHPGRADCAAPEGAKT